MIKIKVPVASADRYMFSLLLGCDFLHPYSSHNKPTGIFKSNQDNSVKDDKRIKRITDNTKVVTAD